MSRGSSSELFSRSHCSAAYKFHLVKHSGFLSIGPAVSTQPMFLVQHLTFIIESWTDSMMLLYVIISSSQLIFYLEVITATGMNEFVLLGRAGLK